MFIYDAICKQILIMLPRKILKLSNNIIKFDRIVSKSFRIAPSLCSNRNILRLKERGVFSDLFPDGAADNVVDVLNSAPQTVYAGFDPTADSLHVGNLAILVNLINWQRAGHNVIALIGGATGQIGDPSGKSTERPELEKDKVTHNANEIKQLIEKIFKNHEEVFWKEKKDKLLPIR